MTTARELRTASKATLRQQIVNGYPVDPAATILEWSKTNNVLVESEWWYNGGGLHYCD